MRPLTAGPGMSEGETKSSLSRTILRNTLTVSLGSAVVRIPGFLFTLYIVRGLGDATYGQYATILAFGGMFAVFFELGATKYVERTVAQDRSLTRDLFWQLVATRLALSVLAIVVLTSAAVALGYERIVVVGIALHSATYVFAALLSSLTTLFASFERYDLWTKAKVFGQLASMIVGTLVVWQGYGLMGLMIAGLIVMPPQIVYCVVVVRRLWPDALRFRFRIAETVPFLRASLPFGLSSLALTISYNADIFILSLYYPSHVVGWYSAAYRLIPTIVSMLGAFLIVVTPSLASRYVSEPEVVRAWVRNCIRGLAIFGLPTAVGLSMLAPEAVDVFYGPTYQPAAVALALLAWDVPLRLFNALAGNVAIAANLERVSSGIVTTSSVVGLLLLLVAIPLFGIVGAAVVKVVADGLTAVAYFVLFCRRLETAPVLAPLGRTVLAVVPMSVFLWLAAPQMNLAATVVTGATIYGATVLAFGLIDRALLQQVVRRLAWR